MKKFRCKIPHILCKFQRFSIRRSQVLLGTVLYTFIFPLYMTKFSKTEHFLLKGGLSTVIEDSFQTLLYAFSIVSIKRSSNCITNGHILLLYHTPYFTTAHSCSLNSFFSHFSFALTFLLIHSVPFKKPCLWTPNKFHSSLCSSVLKPDTVLNTLYFYFLSHILLTWKLAFLYKWRPTAARRMCKMLQNIVLVMTKIFTKSS